MARRTWLVAGLALAALTTAMAEGAWAQEPISRGRGRASGTKFAFGTEVWGESRGVIYSDAEFNQIGVTNTLDERTIEHDTVHSFGHVGTFLSAQARIDGDVVIRLGARVGTFIGMTRSNQEMPGSFREVSDIVTRPGFAGGIIADVRLPLQSGVWIGGTLDFFVGQAAFDNLENGFGGTIWEGTYFFLLPELSARVGFAMKDGGASPFIGVAASFFQGTVDLEDPNVTAPGSFESIEGTAGNWSFVRVILGVEFGDTPVLSRLQIAIWNPSRDFGAHVMAVIVF